MKAMYACFASVLAATLLFSAGCSRSGGIFSSGESFVILAGSENKSLEPILQKFAQERGVKLQMQYKGSVDMMLEFRQGGQMPYDAVWPANSLWITLGDTRKAIKNAESVMNSPVVFGVKQSVAKKLGWLDKEITIADILKAAEAGEFKFAMTSATQSNSGATAYLGFLNALAGSPNVLTHENLADKKVQEKTRNLLKSIDRSSGSSGWLKDLVVEKYDQFQAMVNYEAMIIEANQQLASQGKEPMVALYPADGITIADFPLGYVDRGQPKKEVFFKALIEHLKSPTGQKEILAQGRRTGLVGLDANAIDPAVFNPAWGIDVKRVISPVPLPSEPVIREALNLYQAGGLRKPSATAYVLDFSGSMQGEGCNQVKAAMALLLDPVQSSEFLLQPSDADIHIVVPFDGAPRPTFSAKGNDPKELQQLLDRVRSLEADDGTDIYAGVVRGLQELRKHDLNGYFPAVILMTDGKSQGNPELLWRELNRSRMGPEIPVFSITFGDADESQLQTISDRASGKIFEGKKDLSQAFRSAKGYN